MYGVYAGNLSWSIHSERVVIASSTPTPEVIEVLLRLLLWVVGVSLSLASRTSPRVQSQLSRNMTIVLGSKDGISRSFTVNDRRIDSSAHPAENVVCAIRFRTGSIGVRIFLASDAIGQIVDGLGTGDVECDGEAALILWFYELTMGLLPWRGIRTEAWPQSYIAPRSDLKASSRIIREPFIDALDPEWKDAVLQREKLEIWKVGAGAEPSGKLVNHKIVVHPMMEQGNGVYD